MTSRAARQGGFTVVEVLLTTVIGLAAVTGFMSMATFQITASRDQANQLDLQQTVRDVAELVAREVRRVGADPTCAGSFESMEYASFWGIRLKSDLDGSGAIDSPDENVLYVYTGDRFLRSTTAGSDTLIDNVNWDGSRLRYFDGAGVEIDTGFQPLSAAQRAAVRRVRLVLDVRHVTDAGETVSAKAATDINLRNRFFVQNTGCPS